jgi:hypothetical protein
MENDAKNLSVLTVVIEEPRGGQWTEHYHQAHVSAAWAVKVLQGIVERVQKPDPQDKLRIVSFYWRQNPDT